MAEVVIAGEVDRHWLMSQSGSRCGTGDRWPSSRNRVPKYYD
jgi:hypothetical protein